MWRKNTFPVGPVAGTAYEEPFRKLNRMLKQMETESATAEEVAQFLVRVFETPNPKARYAHSRALMDGPRTMQIPALWYDALLGAMFGLKPRKASEV